MNKAHYLLKKHSPLILTCVGAIGTVVTSILAVKATPEAIDLIKDATWEKNVDILDDGDDYYTNLIPLTKIETVKAAWVPYIPTFISGFATISCIFGAHYLNHKTQASLISAYGVLQNTYNKYVEKTKELYGEEADIAIKKEIAKEYYRDTPSKDRPTDKEQLFFDYQSMRYFESSMDDVIKAEDRLNQEFAASGVVSLNTWYDIIGLDRVSYGDRIGWFGKGDYYEIPFEHERTQVDGDLDVFVITFDITPHTI